VKAFQPLLVDLFCCQGGASKGYVDAGFRVIGVDIDPQPRYPYEFVQGDALEVLDLLGDHVDAVHASPPCQGYSNAQRIQGRDHPMLIDAVREKLEVLGKPYVIENVPGAPLKAPIELCGEMFGLRTYRHRLFESNAGLVAPAHRPHAVRQVKMGRPLREGDFYQAVGNFSNVPYVRADMGVPWMNRDGIRESIPPAYASFVGMFLLDAIERAAGEGEGDS
jgi:DNA (cytosine-5)-methyltransferase 1